MQSREAWAKRRYEPHFLRKVTNSSLDFARECGYISNEKHDQLTSKCTKVRRMLGGMMKKPNVFIIAE